MIKITKTQNKKLIKYIFLDTNVFYHCKFFTEIDWKSLFPSKSVENIIIKVPNVVLRELDKGKYDKKRVRQVISKFEELKKNPEFKDGIKIQFSLLPTKWDTLEHEHQEILDPEANDHHIIAEILNLCKDYPKENIYFVTGDFLPSMVSMEIGINTIYCRDKKFKERFYDVEVKKKALPDLQISFDPEGKEFYVEISSEKKPPELMEFEKSEDEDFSYDPSKMSTKEIIVSGFVSKVISNLHQKSEEKFMREVDDYNKRILEYTQYREVKLFLINNGIMPYNNIDINITTTLEKGFEIKNKEELPKPIKPERDFDSSGVGYFPRIFAKKKEPNVKYYEIKEEDHEKNRDWSFGYHIDKLKHGDYEKLYPIMICIPDNPKTNEITLKCVFTQEEEGKIKTQRLKILLSKK